MKKLKLSGKEMLTKEQLKEISGGYLHGDCACLNDLWCPWPGGGGLYNNCSNPNAFVCRETPGDYSGWGLCSTF